MMLQIRKALTSRNATLSFRILLGLIAMMLIADSVRSVEILQTYDVQFGTTFWFVNVLTIVLAIVGVLCILMMSRRWYWAVWVWAVSVLGVALIGILIGLNVRFLMQWHVVLPWVLLLASAILRNRFAMPWKIGNLGRTTWGVIGLLVCLGVGVQTIHQKVTTERNVFLEPLKESIAEQNRQLPMMVNDELRLDRVSVEFDGVHQYMTFPQYTVSELALDPGLDFVRDYYGDFYMSQICELPECRQKATEGKSCSGTFYYEVVDMNGEQVVSFSLDGSNCRYESDKSGAGTMITDTGIDRSDIEGGPVMVFKVDRDEDVGGQTVGDLLKLMEEDSNGFPTKDDYSNCDELISLIRGGGEIELVEISAMAVVTRTEQATMIYNFPNGDCAPE